MSNGLTRTLVIREMNFVCKCPECGSVLKFNSMELRPEDVGSHELFFSCTNKKCKDPLTKVNLL